MKIDKTIGNAKTLVLCIGVFLCGLLIGIGIFVFSPPPKILGMLNSNSLISGAIGSIFGAIGGGLVSLLVSIFTQNRNWDRQREKEEEKRQTEEVQLFTKFFMELNYNRRKIIYTIENDKYKLTGLDNFHWKNFIYSKASLFLSKDKILLDDLATLDSMIDQVNDRIQSIKESEIAIICNIGHSVIDTNIPKKLCLELQKYAKDELKPRIDKTIEKLEKLYKESTTKQSN